MDERGETAKERLLILIGHMDEAAARSYLHLLETDDGTVPHGGRQERPADINSKEASTKAG